MSYCRWSCLNFSCDVYVYESVQGGFVIHIAGNRVKGDIPKLPRFTKDNLEAWNDANQEQLKFLETAEREDIDLPMAGGEIVLQTAGDCASQLEELRKLGYNVPQYAIDALREEAKEDEA